MKKYNIREELIDQYVKRKVNKKIITVLIIVFIFLLAMFIFTYSYGTHKIVMPFMIIFFLIIIGVIYLSSFPQIRDSIKVTSFIITDDSVSIFLDKEKLNLLNKIGFARMESKYGVKFNQTIAISRIQSTLINENEIIIKSFDYNIITSNGKIIIPKEVENFSEIKSDIINNPTKYKLAL